MVHRSFLRNAIYSSIFSALSLSPVVPNISATPQEGRPQDTPAGDWRGTSTCQVKPSGCHDEEALYQVRPSGTDPRTYELKANKIIDGKPITMGTGPCTYDAAKHHLSCPISQNGSLMELDLHGDQMIGTMKMRDGTIWRKITLKRTPEE